ncbi:hypothetical protein BN439_2147 [Erwinia amylovora Ea644]|nr:hypothetical protein BN439_2147 [Erwinia amylovora Ea644]
MQGRPLAAPFLYAKQTKKLTNSPVWYIMAGCT